MERATDKVNFAFGSRDYRICGQSVLPRIALNLRNTKPTFPLNRYVSLPDKGETNRLRLRQEQWRIKRTLKPSKRKRYSSSNRIISEFETDYRFLELQESEL